MVRRVTLKEKVQRTLNSRNVTMRPGLMQAVVKDNLTKSYGSWCLVKKARESPFLKFMRQCCIRKSGTCKVND